MPSPPPIRRRAPEINAGSMADIAFLMLIFFLVTTEITEDEGVLVKLPPWAPSNVPPAPIPENNVFSVLVNGADELLVEGERVNLADLRGRAKEFITNPRRRTDLPSAPRNAIISLRNDRGTGYATYLAVYNELRAAYTELWDELARERYGLPYSEDLPLEVKHDIKATIPLVLSEAEPTDYAVD